jgi:hypothetical protein
LEGGVKERKQTKTARDRDKKKKKAMENGRERTSRSQFCSTDPVTVNEEKKGESNQTTNFPFSL